MPIEYPIRGGSVLIDEESLPIAERFKWRTSKDGYAIRTVNTRENGIHRTTSEFLHRRLMKARPGQIVDHINRVRTDNRLSNLRFVTALESTLNRAVSKAPGGYITLHPGGKWQAAVKGYYLGLFADPDEGRAVAAYARDLLLSGKPMLPKAEIRRLALRRTA